MFLKLLERDSRQFRARKFNRGVIVVLADERILFVAAFNVRIAHYPLAGRNEAQDLLRAFAVVNYQMCRLFRIVLYDNKSNHCQNR